MANKPHTLSGEFHIQQFHNADHYPEGDSAPMRMWWEMGESEKPAGYASGGSVISQLRKRGSANKSESADFGSHPAHKIPGIHIVTAQTGEPIFHGDE